MTAFLPPDYEDKPKKPRTCPRCGSDSIAKIMYGMPAFSAELDEALRTGKLSLGGCCVSDESPRWECNECGRTWGRESGDMADEDVKFDIRIGGYFGPNYSLKLGRRELVYTKITEELPDGKSETIVPSNQEWRRFWKFAQDSCDEWDEEYEEPGVVDGTSWTVEIVTDEIDLRSSGSNAYPDNFDEFLEEVSRLIGGRDFE